MYYTFDCPKCEEELTAEVDKEIIEVAPTDGLWNDTRTDAQQLGASYKEFEWVMEWLKESSVSKIEELTYRQREVIDLYQKWNSAGKHKVYPIPVFKRNR